MNGWRLVDVEALTREEYDDLVEWLEDLQDAQKGR